MFQAVNTYGLTALLLRIALELYNAKNGSLLLLVYLEHLERPVKLMCPIQPGDPAKLCILSDAPMPPGETTRFVDFRA